MYVNKGVGTWERHSDRYLYKREDQQSAYTLVTLLINDTYLDRGEETELTEMNDEGCTFEEIADFLERRYIKGETVDYADYIRIARERS